MIRRIKDQERTTPLFGITQKNNLPLFSCSPATKEKSSDNLKIASLKSNCSLFLRLYVSCLVTDGDLKGFFGHENQSFPPSLSQYGKLRSGTKSDLLSCLEKNGPAQAQRPSVEALLLDGAAIVNMLKPGASKTFEEYSETVFLPCVINQLRNVEKVDAVWDRYLPSSLNTPGQLWRKKVHFVTAVKFTLHSSNAHLSRDHIMAALASVSVEEALEEVWNVEEIDEEMPLKDV